MRECRSAGVQENGSAEASEAVMPDGRSARHWRQQTSDLLANPLRPKKSAPLRLHDLLRNWRASSRCRFQSSTAAPSVAHQGGR